MASTTIEQIDELLAQDRELSDARHEVVAFLSLFAKHPTSVPSVSSIAAHRDNSKSVFHRQVFSEVEMIDSAYLTDRAGVASPRNMLMRLRELPGVIVVQRGTARVLPAFQFDESLHLRRPVAEANEILLAKADPWGALSWWLAPHPRWEHRRPCEHPDDPVVVRLAAVDRYGDDASV